MMAAYISLLANGWKCQVKSLKNNIKFMSIDILHSDLKKCSPRASIPTDLRPRVSRYEGIQSGA